MDTATAAAQTVIILDTLDRSVFDLSTFQLGYVMIADTLVPIGTEIKNKAYIYFDANEPIITNEWVNKRDITKPTSSVASLPQTQLNDSTIVLRWSGTDTGSGINHYDIYYSIDGSEFQLLVQNYS